MPKFCAETTIATLDRVEDYLLPHTGKSRNTCGNCENFVNKQACYSGLCLLDCDRVFSRDAACDRFSSADFGGVT